MLKTVLAACAALCALSIPAGAAPRPPSAAACIPTDDLMRPCAWLPDRPTGQRVAPVTMKRVRVLAAPPTAITGDLRMMVEAAAYSAGVPPRLAHAVIRQESNYNPRLRGAAGEWGIGQIKCQTARSVGFLGPCGWLAEAATNLRYAMAYLRLVLNRGGEGCDGVSLYQRGIYARPVCSAYGRAVMRKAGG